MDTRHSLFKTQVKELLDFDWKVKFDPVTFEARIVNEKGEELDGFALGIMLGEIEDYAKRKNEQKNIGERKQPIDEFSRKRLELEDYVLVKDEDSKIGRRIFEAYHDRNDILTLDSYVVAKSNNLIYPEFTAHILVEDVEKILPTLQAFVRKKKRD